VLQNTKFCDALFRYIAVLGSDVKRGQNLEDEAEAEAKNNYEKYQIMINNT